MSTMKRRELFTSFSSRFTKNKEDAVLRPPYFSDYSLFDKECPVCKGKECSTFCEEEIITIDERGLAYISFQDSGCTYCDKCADACGKGVLAIEDKSNINAQVSISTHECLAWKDVMCSSCLDACDPRAIKFFGVFRPIVDMELCTSCGFCFSVCPTDAIIFKGV